MPKIGQADGNEIELIVAMEVAFSKQEISSLLKANTRYIIDTSFSITMCLQEKIKRKTNCQVDWFTDG